VTNRDAERSEDVRDRLANIGEIASEIAHELRNVLQVISASAYLARHDPQAATPHLAKIERNARLAHAIVDDLMSLARGDPLRAEPVALADVISAARDDLEPNATWVDAIEPNTLHARAHTQLASRMIHVLYENAVGASAPRRPTIETRAHLENGRVFIDVADDGPGVSPDVAARIFEPLVTGRPGGTGLGLALARRIAAAHGGSISLVDSEHGATFRVELPGA
jgi:signal transduction histidine kinase